MRQLFIYMSHLVCTTLFQSASKRKVTLIAGNLELIRLEWTDCYAHFRLLF